MDLQRGGAFLDDEKALRSRLGVPAEAERVLIFTESSHWDPNWMLTSNGYFALRVRRNLDQAISALIEDPRRVYSVECAFFLRMYWERCPSRREAVLTLANQGRLRLMGSGVTTPDTIIPSPESLVRDYLLGQEWLRETGFEAEPAIAYFPDSFGHSPGLPGIMRAVGVDAAAICRIDGMLFLGCETDMPGRFPWRGTSAELLMREERTQDFVWRGPDGSEILAHWVAYGYGQGELLAHVGVTRVAGAPAALRWRTDRNVTHHIERYVRQLGKFARTPYMLCPIGFDFSAPIPRINDLLDRYNERHYSKSGTWVVNAGLDDYLALVNNYRSELPVIELDPNPYFSGFLTSRSTVKRHAQELADTLIAADAACLDPRSAVAPAEATRRLTESWWFSATSNHHDYITGTAPDRVVDKEQMPWLRDGLRTARAVHADATRSLDTSDTGPAPERSGIQWSRDGGLVDVSTSMLRVTFDEAAGGCATRITGADGVDLGAGLPAFDVTSYLDTGGLWRMGLEFPGGKFVRTESTGQGRARIEVADEDGCVEVRSISTLEGERVVRAFRFEDDSATIQVRIEGRVPDDRTFTLSVPVRGSADAVVVDVPGGVVRRPARRRFDPTFWSAQTFAAFAGSAVFLALPGAIAAHPDIPSAEIVVARNATKERILKVLPIPGFPARGHDPGPHVFECAVDLAVPGGWRESRLAQRAARYVARRRHGSTKDTPLYDPGRIVSTDRDDVWVSAVKPAHRGEGIVVRLTSVADGPVEATLTWTGRAVGSAALCDGRERDLGVLDVSGSTASVPVSGSITSVRLVPAEAI